MSKFNVNGKRAIIIAVDGPSCYGFCFPAIETMSAHLAWWSRNSAGVFA